MDVNQLMIPVYILSLIHIYDTNSPENGIIGNLIPLEDSLNSRCNGKDFADVYKRQVCNRAGKLSFSAHRASGGLYTFSYSFKVTWLQKEKMCIRDRAMVIGYRTLNAFLTIDRSVPLRIQKYICHPASCSQIGRAHV